MRSIRILVTIVVLIISVPQARSDDWFLADDKDEKILEALRPCLDVASRQFDAHDTDVVIVLSQVFLDAKRESFKKTESRVWWVRAGEVPDLTNFVADYRPGEKVDKVAAFVIRPTALRPEAVVEAEVEKLDKARIQLQKGDDESRYSNLVVAFPAAESGMLLGISVRTKYDYALQWFAHEVKDEIPVARSQLRLKNDDYLAYLSAAQRLEQGALKRQILEERHGRTKDVITTIDDLAPVHREPYSPPVSLQSPRVIVALHAELYEFGNGSMVWWPQESWNQVALGLASVEDSRLREHDRAQQEVERIRASLAETEDLRDAIFRYTRDELGSIDSWIFSLGNRATTVDETIESGSGSVQDRAFLLLAMLRLAGYRASLSWAQEPDDGSILIQYPNYFQLPHPLIVAGEGNDQKWYDLGCSTCPPGDLRPRLRGVSSFLYEEGLDRADEELMYKAQDQAIMNNVSLTDTYRTMVGQQTWGRWVITPGDRKRVAGQSSEELFVPGDGGPALYTLQASGRNTFRESWTRVSDQTAFVQSWFEGRFDQVDVASVLAPDIDGDTVTVTLEGSSMLLPPPAGDTWVLPGEMVYGSPCVGEWPEQRMSAFYVRASQVREFTFRTPLPPGWKGARLPSAVTIGARENDPLYYTASFRVQDGELWVERSLREEAWYTDEKSDLSILAARAAAIVAAERAPIVLQRWDEAPASTGR